MAKELSQKELATVSKIIFIKQMKALESNVMAYVRKRWKSKYNKLSNVLLFNLYINI